MARRRRRASKNRHCRGTKQSSARRILAIERSRRARARAISRKSEAQPRHGGACGGKKSQRSAFVCRRLTGLKMSETRQRGVGEQREENNDTVRRRHLDGSKQVTSIAT